MAYKKTGRPFKKPKRNKILPIQAEFIAEYMSNGGQKSKAATNLNIPYRKVMQWFATDEAFQEEVDRVRSSWYDALEATMLARAHAKSDTLLIFALKAQFPEKYDDNIRALNWRAKQLAEGGTMAPPRITFVRDEETLKLVEPVSASKTITKLINGTNGLAHDSEPVEVLDPEEDDN